jgi:hypothetical protein
MHNEYIYLKRIRDERDRLLLLKYSEIDITSISEILKKITIELMEQCNKHIEEFDKINSYRDKKYYLIEEQISEELETLKYIKTKYIEYFNLPGNKTKEDLFVYIFGYQLSANYYNEYLYAVLISLLKKEINESFWDKHDLSRFEVDTDFITEYYILKDTKNECSTGKININIDKVAEILAKYFKDKDIDSIQKKTTIIKQISLILDNYYNKDFPYFNKPYKDSAEELINHIKVYQDLDKPIHLIKKI